MTYNPWLDAARRYPDVHIEWRALLPAHAVWAPAQRVILIDESISRAERRAALAHEIAHMDTGDRPTDQCWFAARQETNADRLAARRLVDVCNLAAVIRWCHDPREIAAELDVPLRVLASAISNAAPCRAGVPDHDLERPRSRGVSNTAEGTRMTTPGWYPDPDDPTARRYWDGQYWSAPLPRPQFAGPQQAATTLGGPTQPAVDGAHLNLPRPAH